MSQQSGIYAIGSGQSFITVPTPSGNNLSFFLNGNDGNKLYAMRHDRSVFLVPTGVAPVDNKVSVSAADTTPSFLQSKLVAGADVTFTLNNPGANETLTIAVTGNFLTKGSNVYVGNTTIQNTGTLLIQPTSDLTVGVGGNFSETISGTETATVTGLSTRTYTNGLSWRTSGFGPIHVQAGATDFSKSFIAMQSGFGLQLGYDLIGTNTSILFDQLSQITLNAANKFIITTPGMEWTNTGSSFWKTTGNNAGIEIYANDTGASGFLALGVTTTPVVRIGTGGKQVIINGLHVNITELQDFATNAAAIVGGLVTDDLYYTNTAGEAVVKIVI